MGPAARLIATSVKTAHQVAVVVRGRRLEFPRWTTEVRNITQGLQNSQARKTPGPAAATPFPWHSVSVI